MTFTDFQITIFEVTVQMYRGGNFEKIAIRYLPLLQDIEANPRGR